MSRTIVFLCLFALSLCFTVAEGADEGKFFNSNGVQIHYLDVGSGEPVVLMHGQNGSVQTWVDNGVSEKLVAAGYRVLALDARAHGKSGTPHEPSEYGQEMALDIVRLMDHVGVDKAHIVGYSMGSAIVGRLRSEHPERMMTLCLGGSGWVNWDGPSERHIAIADSLERGDGFMPLYDAIYPDWSEEDRVARSEKAVAALPDVQARVALFRGWSFGVTEESLRENTVPTLAIIGSIDPLKTGVDALDGVMPHLETVVIEGAGHLAAIQHPEYIASLLTFLSKHVGVPGSAIGRQASLRRH